MGFALGLLLGSVQIVNDLRIERKKIDANFYQILNVMKNSAAQAAYGLDEKLARSVVDGLFEYKPVFYAVVQDDLKNVLASLRRARQPSPYRWFATALFGDDRMYEIPLMLEPNGKRFGTLSINVDSFLIAQSFFNRSGFILLSGILRNMIFAVMLAVAFHLMLTKPLHQLAAAVRRGDRNVGVPAGHEEDELGQMASDYNKLMANRLAAEGELRQMHEKSEALVAARTKELNDANDKLEERVLERTKELEIAKNQAESADRAKAEFLANMSHELRTPLNAILGFADIIIGRVFGPLGNEKYQEYVADIRNSGLHLLAIINDILDLSKIKSGMAAPNPENNDIGVIVEDAAVLVRKEIEDAGLTLEIDVPSSMPVYLDGRYLKQILLNLLSNAVKFTKPGGAVHVAAVITDEASLEISVADTGIGMDENAIAMALVEFGQVDSGLSRRYEGTGLGLPLAKAYAELLGGALRIESKPGYGTTATVRLPKQCFTERSA